MIRIYGGTDQGCVRVSNQDAYTFQVINEDTAFVVLCDGMGGEAGGHVASARAVEIMAQSISRGLLSGVPAASLQSLLVSAATGANAVIRDMAQAQPDYLGMGTTLVAAILRENMLYVGHAGDSRLYELSAGEPRVLRQLTHDHSVVQMLVDGHEITEQEARMHPKRNLITRALGVDPQFELEYTELPFESGRLLFCSDGLYNYAPPEDHIDLIATCENEQDIYLLIDEANKAGGPDNITAVIVAK